MSQTRLSRIEAAIEYASESSVIAGFEVRTFDIGSASFTFHAPDGGRHPINVVDRWLDAGWPLDDAAAIASEAEPIFFEELSRRSPPWDAARVAIETAVRGQTRRAA